jgi:hypothetical protein
VDRFLQGKTPGYTIFAVSAMDTIGVLALAGAVIQFVDLGTKFLSKVVSGKGEIYKAMKEGSVENGFADANRILGRSVNMISTITAQIQKLLRPNGSSVAANGDERALIELCKGCNTIATEIISRLDELKTKGFQIKNQKIRKLGLDNRTGSFLSALKALWTGDELSNMSQRFLIVKMTLEVNILVSIRLEPILLC